MGRAHTIFNRPVPVHAVPCDICGKKILTREAQARHDHCQGKPSPCLCGQPSMPDPECPGCRGTGRVQEQVCQQCRPGPCVGCCMKTFLAHWRDETRKEPS